MSTFPDTAVRVGIVKLRCLLESGADVRETDSKGRTALFRTSRSGDAEKVSTLLTAGSDPNACDATGETPLQTAARYGHLDCINALLKAGANIDHCPPVGRSEYVETALASAVRKSPEAARLLLDRGADPNAGLDQNRLPLIAAACWQRSELLPLLVKHGAKLDSHDNMGRTALHCAALQGDAIAVRALLDAGANPNTEDENGETPVFATLTNEGDRIETLRQLLRAQPDLSKPSRYWKMTALERAIDIEDSEAADLLRSAGSPPPKQNIDKDGPEVTLTIQFTDEDLEGFISRKTNLPPDWRDAIDPVEKASILPTLIDFELASTVDRELPTVLATVGPDLSPSHWELLRHAFKPLPLTRMAYFARGFLNAPKGQELEDGPKVLGEAYTRAAERFVAQGLLERLPDSSAIDLAFTGAELSVIAFQNQIRPTGSKADLARRLVNEVGLGPFSIRLQACGGFFMLTPAGTNQADGFKAHLAEFIRSQRNKWIDTLVNHDFTNAIRIVRSLELVNRGHWQVKTDPKRLARARATRSRNLPNTLIIDPSMEPRYLSIIAAHALHEPSRDWEFWDLGLAHPKTHSGESVELEELASALLSPAVFEASED